MICTKDTRAFQTSQFCKNFAVLANSGKKFVVRTPMIPEVTDTEENIHGICDILSSNGVKYVELLPYNKLAGAKYPLVGREYCPSFDGSTEPQMRFEIFEKYGIKAVKM